MKDTNTYTRRAKLETMATKKFLPKMPIKYYSCRTKTTPQLLTTLTLANIPDFLT